MSYESQSDLVGALKFLEGPFVKMAQKETRENLAKMKRVIEAR